MAASKIKFDQLINTRERFLAAALESRRLARLPNPDADALLLPEPERIGRVVFNVEDTPDSILEALTAQYVADQIELKFRVLDLDDSELGQAATREEAIQIFLERHPHFHKGSIDPFIYDI